MMLVDVDAILRSAVGRRSSSAMVDASLIEAKQRHGTTRVQGRAKLSADMGSNTGADTNSGTDTRTDADILSNSNANSNTDRRPDADIISNE